MNDAVLLAGFSNMDLVDFHYHIDWQSWKGSYIELTAQGQGRKRHLRFSGVSNLRIDEGFNGSLSGMEIVDISDRQWDSARIEVRNFEQDPGVTFLAATMETVSDT
ncbi:hypothetical protein [Polaromonas aquatica]|uniref:hypothetical protein n=1 Tax=Polaromonas aquatica TaxID=332657 RepID=UPI003D64FC32